MLYEDRLRYFFSIQPFWNINQIENSVRNECISVARFHWTERELSCVPGNGQVGIMLSGPENFSGYCFGVMKQRDNIDLHGVQDGYFIRFSPGTFSVLCRIPSVEIPAQGIELSQVFSQERLNQLKDAIANDAPEEALLRLCEVWEFTAKCSGREQALAEEVIHMIWANRGALRMKDLEEETLYSARRLQEVVTRQVGIGPKQLCRQTRFQNALKFLQHTPQKLSQAQAAQFLGYSDQAHYNREFKEFAGISPCQLQKMAR